LVYHEQHKIFDEKQKTNEMKDEFICFFNSKELIIILFGEIVKTPVGEIAIFENAINALNAA
jgi:hypothetical protein